MVTLRLFTIGAVLLANASPLPCFAASVASALAPPATPLSAPVPVPTPTGLQLQVHGQGHQVSGGGACRVEKVTIQIMGTLHLPSPTASEGQLKVVLPFAGM